MADQEQSRPIQRPMMKCKKCGAWQTIMPIAPFATDDLAPPCGGCGGELERVDWEAHRKSQPYVPYNPEKEKPKS